MIPLRSDHAGRAGQPWGATKPCPVRPALLCSPAVFWQLTYFFLYFFFLLHASLGKVPHFKKSIERHHSSCQQRMQSRIYRAGWECCADPLLCEQAELLPALLRNCFASYSEEQFWPLELLTCYTPMSAFKPPLIPSPISPVSFSS